MMWISDVTAPSGPTSPSNLLAVCIALPIVCIIIVALRFDFRRLQKTSLRLDDWVMLPALICFLGMAVCGLIGETHGVWAHLTPAAVADGDNKDASTNGTLMEGILLEVVQYIQIFALTFIKIGALAFCDRVFHTKTHRTVFDTVRMITMIVVGLWAIVMVLMNSFQCGSHIAALWIGYNDWSVYCSVLSPAYEEAFGITNFLLNLWIILLPLPKIFNLHTKLTRKFAISGIFLMASVGLAAAIVRMVFYIQVIYENGLNPLIYYRLMNTLQVYWSVFEAGMSLIAVSLPSLWFYFSKLSLERVLASIRSAISLSSLRSDRGSGSRSRLGGSNHPPPDSQSIQSKSSQTNFLVPENTKVHAMYDVEAQKSTPAPGVIEVNSTVEQTKTAV